MKTQLILTGFCVLFLACKKLPEKSKKETQESPIETVQEPSNDKPKIQEVQVDEVYAKYDLHPSIEPKREFRAAWVASVANIDWPSAKGLNSEQQKQEFLQILDHHKSMGVNAVIVQIRAASDAFYLKSVEPWSEWLMGEQGQPPYPLYDPLEFMIEACHQRAMEFHAWFNLNRGRHKKGTSFTPNHITVTQPNWFLEYDGYLLYDFGLPAVRKYIQDIVLNVVENYDVDGIHFDDYFYPYKVTGKSLPDQGTFLMHNRGIQNIEDWRRDNIDLIIKNLGEAIFKKKKWVKFGVSPFCAWRNKSDDPEGSDTRAGQPSYDFLYADTRKWAKEGWVDYMAPQIYFTFESRFVPYKTMTDWWVNNVGKTHLYIGHGVYRVDPSSQSDGWNEASQLSRQINYNRSKSKVSGSIFYNTNSLMKNRLGVRDSIASAYKFAALQPTVPWKDHIQPEPPEDLTIKAANLSWQPSPVSSQDGDEAHLYVVYVFDNPQVINLQDATCIVAVLPSKKLSLNVNASLRGKTFVVTALDRLKNESKPSKYIVWK